MIEHHLVSHSHLAMPHDEACYYQVAMHHLVICDTLVIQEQLVIR
jgi:hypothetical protein